jgi:hypothetical protein
MILKFYSDHGIKTCLIVDQIIVDVRSASTVVGETSTKLVLNRQTIAYVTKNCRIKLSNTFNNHQAL